MAQAEVPADSTLSAAEIRRRRSLSHGDTMKYRRSFDSMDLEKEGLIKASDICSVATKLGYRLTEEQVKELLQKSGLSDSSKISFERFLELIPWNEDVLTEDDHKIADLREKFQRYDIDGNGEISLQEAQWALQFEMRISPTTALRLLNQFVRLNYDQFVDFYKQVQNKKLEIYEKFGRYDTNQDGMISMEEAHDVLQGELGYSLERSQAMVKHFDVNHDGRVSYIEFAEFYIAVEEKKAKIRKTFHHFDQEGNGFVTNEVAVKILRDVLGFPEKRAESAIQNFDKNKDGKIDYEEFLAFYSMLEEERQRLTEEFKKYDKDEDGRISFEEFQTMLSEKGYAENEIKSLMTGYDVNNDGFLDFNEFKCFLNFS